LLIDIMPPSRQQVKQMTTLFALQQDDWNDYSFHTLYHLYYRRSENETDVVYIGRVKILRKGQTERDPILIREPFASLSEEFVSVGNDLDYYQRLNELPSSDRTAIMEALNDAVTHPDLITKFQDEPGWRTSVFRGNSDWRPYIVDAQILVEGNFSALPDIAQSFGYTPPGTDESIEFDFRAPKPAPYFGPYRSLGPWRKDTLLPERIIVLIGRNGSGKSTLLSRLAHLSFASPQDRTTKRLKALGQLFPPSLGFMRVITVSYSAFDSFVIPGIAARDIAQTTKDIGSGESRFVFCGLRDLVAEGLADVEEAEKNAGAKSSQTGELLVERRNSTRLKSVESLAREFSELLARIEQAGSIELLMSALQPLTADPSFAELQGQLGDLVNSAETREPLFLSWSTGHKIALHVIVQLVASARPRSLVLFDEPEAHLHPPLMAALMHSVRVVLTQVNAFCIVATHSPVLLQETLARHVRIVRRVGETLEIKPPSLETFGENLGILTYDAFGLTAASTDFHEALDLLVAGCASPEVVDRLFTPGLSGQARAYVLSRFAAKA
jgi:ABC-type lipoprotein export system ATPase subunit